MILYDSFDDQEYLCGIITGSHRKGKTLFLAWTALKTFSAYKKVYANFWLDIPNFERLESFDENTLSLLEENSLVLITELHHYIDCRNSMDRNQVSLTETLQEIGKLHCHFIGDIKDTTMLDIRMRALFTFSIHAFGSRKRLSERYKDVYKYGLYRDNNLPYLLDYPESTKLYYMKEVYQKYKTTEFITLKKEEKKKEKKKEKTVLTEWS